MIERRMTHHAMDAVFALMGMSGKGDMVRLFEKNMREWETDVVLCALCIIYFDASHFQVTMSLRGEIERRQPLDLDEAISWFNAGDCFVESNFLRSFDSPRNDDYLNIFDDTS